MILAAGMFALERVQRGVVVTGAEVDQVIGVGLFACETDARAGLF